MFMIRFPMTRGWNGDSGSRFWDYKILGTFPPVSLGSEYILLYINVVHIPSIDFTCLESLSRQTIVSSRKDKLRTLNALAVAIIHCDPMRVFRNKIQTPGRHREEASRNDSQEVSADDESDFTVGRKVLSYFRCLKLFK